MCFPFEKYTRTNLKTEESTRKETNSKTEKAREGKLFSLRKHSNIVARSVKYKHRSYDSRSNKKLGETKKHSILILHILFKQIGI